MKKALFIFGLIVLINQPVFSQWLDNSWEKSFRNGNAKGLAIAVDSSDYCYVTGYSDNNTGKDIVTIKHDSMGDTLWARTYNGSANLDDEGLAIAVDAVGNVYVTGYVDDYGEGANIVLLKYSSAGTLQWVKRYNGSGIGEDKAFGISIDAAGYIYVIGYCKNLENNDDIVILKYSSSGTPVWTSLYNSPYGLDDRAFGIAVDAVNNVYVTGYSESLTGYRDIIVIKYSSSAEKLWDKRYNGPANGEDEALSIGIDASSNVYVAGYETTLYGNTDCIVLKYNTSGTLMWTDNYNGSGNSEDKAFGIAVDAASGSSYITGYATDINNGTDYVTIKYNSNGIQQWVSLYNGPGNGDDRAKRIVLLKNFVVVTGASLGTANNYDYASVEYHANNGREFQVVRFSMTTTSNDFATDVTVGKGHKIFVTGYSDLGISSLGEQQVLTTLMMQSPRESIEIPNSPRSYSLYQNYPNPFNPSTKIKFDIIRPGIVKLAVYDMLGREVTTLVNEFLSAGSYETVFSNPKLASGIYFYVLTADDFKDTKKMTLIK